MKIGVHRLSMGNPGDVFHIKGTADENHRHDDLEQKVALLDAKLRELRAEWDEFIEAVEAQNADEPA